MMNRAKSRRRNPSLFDHLKPEEARDVLRRLLSVYPKLRAEAEKIARSHLGEVSFEAIADEVEEAVRALDLDDLNGRAGRHEWGYVEPTEAAWEILQEAVEPFLTDIKPRKKLGLKADALEICKGVVLGLNRVEHNKRSGLLEWAPDFPVEAAGIAIETWHAGERRKKTTRAGPRRSHLPFPREFADRFVPEWRDMIARILSRKR